jgi:hypothetical protein
MRVGRILAVLCVTGLLCGACSKKDETQGQTSTGSAKAAAATGKGSAAPSAATAATTAAAKAATGAPVAADPKAAYNHLPADCDVVGRIDIAKVWSQPAMAKDVLPLLDQIAKKPDAKSQDFKAFQGFLTETGLDLKSSFKSAALCVRNIAAQPKFAFVVAGDLKPETLVAALAKMPMKGKKPTVVDIDGRKAISDAKFTMGQAADGALVFADDKALFQATTATGDSYQSKYQLPLQGEYGIVVADTVAKAMASKDKSMPKEFGAVGRITASVDLAASKAVARLACTTPDDATKINAMLVLMKAQFKEKLEKSGAKNQFGEGKVLDSATSKVEGNDVLIEITLPAELMEQGAKMTAEQLTQLLKTL